MRSTSDEGMQRLRKRFEEAVQGIAVAHGCSAEVGWGRECGGDLPWRVLLKLLLLLI